MQMRVHKPTEVGTHLLVAFCCGKGGECARHRGVMLHHDVSPARLERPAKSQAFHPPSTYLLT